MSRRRPELVLLLRDDLLALRPLSFEKDRSDLRTALRDLYSAYSYDQKDDPGLALLDAFAACIDIMAFYHDRILTESKLGSARLVHSIAKLGAAVGWAPLPPVAATARQFFFATACGIIPAGSKVGGLAGSPPLPVLFETVRELAVAPALNRMAMSPLITQSGGGRRAVIRLVTLDMLESEASVRPVSASDPVVPQPALAPIRLLGRSVSSAASSDLRTLGTELLRARRATLPHPGLRESTTMRMIAGPADDSLRKDQVAALALSESKFRDATEVSGNILTGKRIRQLVMDQTDGKLLPPEDFFLGTDVLLAGPRGLELSQVEVSRKRAIGFARPLLRSHPELDTVISRVTRVRHVHALRLCDDDLHDPKELSNPEFMIFEVSLDPILHIKDAAEPRLLKSTLSVFVFETMVAPDGKNDPRDPLTWDQKSAWTEVADFSASGASDRHYRTFVDDRMATYIMLRRRLGSQQILGDETCKRVYVRYTPAIGSVPQPPPQWPPVAINQKLLQLDPAYFFDSMMRPRSDAGSATGSATWAVTDIDLGVTSDDCIVIDDGSGSTSIRQLTTRPGKSPLVAERKPGGRYLCWAEDQPVKGLFDLAKTTIARIEEVASGNRLLLWEEYYRQARVPGKWKRLSSAERTELEAQYRIRLKSTAWRRRVANKGSSFLILADPSHVKVGDYFLIGKRLCKPYRTDASFDAYSPWLQAEIVQAVEIQGRIVRLKDALAQSYEVECLSKRPAHEMLTEVSVVPAVQSVFYGHCFAQPLTVEAGQAKFDGLSHVQVPYARLELEQPISSPAFRRIGWPSGELPPGPDFAAQVIQRSKQLFLAVAGTLEAYAPDKVQRTLAVKIRGRGLSGNHIQELRMQLPNNVEVPLTPSDGLCVSPAENEPGHLVVQLTPNDAHTVSAYTTGAALWVALKNGISWATRVDGDAGVNGSLEEVWTFYLTPPPPPDLTKRLFAKGGTLRFFATPEDEQYSWSHPFALAKHQGEDALRFTVRPPESRITTAVAISGSATCSTDRVAIQSGAWNALLSNVSQSHVRIVLLDTFGKEELDAALEANAIVFERNDEDLPPLVVKEWRSLLKPNERPSNSTSWPIVLHVSRSSIYDTDRKRFRYRRLSFAQRWTSVSAKDLHYERALLLGPPLAGLGVKLDAGDQVDLEDEKKRTHSCTVASVVLEGEPGKQRQRVVVRGWPQSAIKSVCFQGYAVKPDRTHWHALLSFVPTSPQEPWLLTLQKDGAIGDGLLRYARRESLPAASGECAPQRFRFDQSTEIENITIAWNQPLYLYTNQRAELRDDLYRSASTDDKYKISDNPLTAKAEVSALLIKNNSTLFPPSQPSSGYAQLLFCSSQFGCSQTGPRVLTERDWEDLLQTGLRQPSRRGSASTQLRLLSYSGVFNSGSFISVTGANPETDSKIVKNALRIVVNFGDRAQVVSYNPDLSSYYEKLISGTEAPVDYFAYSFNKTILGAFTLNFLLASVEYEQNSQPKLTVYVLYDAARKHLPEGQTDDAVLYEFETTVAPLVAERQLVVRDPLDLKPGAFVFLRCEASESASAEAPSPPPIEWTQVVSIDGPILNVEPPVLLKTGKQQSPLAISTPEQVLGRILKYSLTTMAKPRTVAHLDLGYYAALKEPTLVPSLTDAERLLPFRDRLVVDPVAGKELLDALLPGDSLLIWDERYRAAWHSLRMASQYVSGVPYAEWPDYQFETTVKALDKEVGLLVLSEPLPRRFAVRYGASEPGGVLSANEADTLALRILPHYRAPFQGPRKLETIGSGDRTHRFARYTGELAAGVGFAVMPLQTPHTYASNIEVLVIEPRSKEWIRYTQFDSLTAAKAKDRAFELGVDLREKTRCSAFSVRFGDGETGQVLPTGDNNVQIRTTDIGWFDEHPQARRALPILGRWHGDAPNVLVEQKVHKEKERELEQLQRGIDPPSSELDAYPRNRNLWIRIPCSGHTMWSRQGGRSSWKSSLAMGFPPTAPPLPRPPLVHPDRELSDEEVGDGHEGFYVVPVRPGIVDVFFFSRQLLALETRIEAWELPDSRQWALDAEFYKDIVAPVELSQSPGATKLQLLETDGLWPSSLLGLAPDEGSELEIATISEIDPDTFSATLEAPLHRAYPTATAYVRGNIVDVTQGATDRLTLGSGDGCTRGLRLPVGNVSTLLHVQKSADSAPEPGLTVLVNGQPWARVDDFAASRPNAHVYCLDVDPNGLVNVRFGDGVNGAVPPEGRDNIEMVVRSGNGALGNLPAGAINKLVDSHIAVSKTWSLTDAAGGRAGDTAEQARKRLMERNLTGKAVVSLSDLTKVVMGIGEVLHARIEPIEELVASSPQKLPSREWRMVVALFARRKPSTEILKKIADQLAPQLPATSGMKLVVRDAAQKDDYAVPVDLEDAALTLRILGARQVPVHLVIELSVMPGHRPAEVMAAVEKVLSGTDFFGAERWPIAEPLRLGDLYEAIFAVAGVQRAQVRWMSTEKPPLPLPQCPNADLVDPGWDGVICCDVDPIADPYALNGSLLIQALEKP